MTTRTEIALPSIVQTFVDNGQLKRSDAVRAVRDASDRKKPIVTHLLERQMVDSVELARACSNQYGMSFVDLDAIDISAQMKQLISEEMMRKLMAVPLFTIGSALIIAVADPAYGFELNDIKVMTKLVPEPVIVEHSKLQRIVYGSDGSDGVATGLVITSEAHNQDLVVGTKTLEQKDDEQDDSNVDVTKFVNELLTHAIKKGVSDIHIEPYERILRVRFRI
ncbi:MAG: hypothetical protein ACPG47_07180, partial [Leucothrix sp.]